MGPVRGSNGLEESTTPHPINWRRHSSPSKWAFASNSELFGCEPWRPVSRASSPDFGHPLRQPDCQPCQPCQLNFSVPSASAAAWCELPAGDQKAGRTRGLPIDLDTSQNSPSQQFFNNEIATASPLFHFCRRRSFLHKNVHCFHDHGQRWRRAEFIQYIVIPSTSSCALRRRCCCRICTLPAVVKEGVKSASFIAKPAVIPAREMLIASVGPQG